MLSHIQRNLDVYDNFILHRDRKYSDLTKNLHRIKVIDTWSDHIHQDLTVWITRCSNIITPDMNVDFDCFNCDVSRVISQYPALLNEISIFRNRKVDPLSVPCRWEVRWKEELTNEIKTPSEKGLWDVNNIKTNNKRIKWKRGTFVKTGKTGDKIYSRIVGLDKMCEWLKQSWNQLVGGCRIGFMCVW